MKKTVGLQAKRHAMRIGFALAVLLVTLMPVLSNFSASAQTTSNGIWISKAELMNLPTSGTAWKRLKAKADTTLGTGNIGDQGSNHDIYTLAAALVAVRTGDPAYRTKTINALLSVIGSEELPDSHCDATPSKARSLAIARNFTAYIVAADLIDFRAGTDNGQGSRWSEYVNLLRFKPNCPNNGSGSTAAFPDGPWATLSETHDASGSNANTQAGAARIAAALYLNDRVELDKAWATYQRYAGDRTQCPACVMRINSPSWQYDPAQPVAVNPAGATKNGHNIDGALVNDISRGGDFTWPPLYTDYPWVGLEGFVAQAHMLARAGYPAWQVSQQAPLRAVAYLKYLGDTFDPAWWNRTDWVKSVVNHAYPGTNFPVGSDDTGFIMAWTDWMYASTSVAVPSSTPTRANTPVPTSTPLPTSTPVPTSTPLPTSMLVPTSTPLPTSMPVPTSTPLPPSTPTPGTSQPSTSAIVLSSSSNGSVSGLTYRDEDIIMYDPASNSWSLIFDGSDVGLGNVDIDGFAFRNGQILLNMDSDFTLNNFGAVDDSDILAFTPSSLGDTTKGNYTIFFDGSDVGLSSSSEDIDAIDFDRDGNLLISVNGTFSAPGSGGSTLRGNDEDIFVLYNGTFGATTAGTWSLYFDGSNVGLTDSGEDVQSLWINHSLQKLYFTTLNDYALTGGLSGNEDDIIICTYTSLGTATSCTLERYWNGQDNGFGTNAIDDLSIGGMPLQINGRAATDAIESVDDTVEYLGDDADDLDELDEEEVVEEEVVEEEAAEGEEVGGMGEENSSHDNHIFMPQIVH